MADASGGTQRSWNPRNPAVKRIVQDLKEIQKDDNPDLIAEALEENIFEWHFCIRGAYETEFERGIYHGRILMPAEYPFKPPAFVMLTPSGRFETGTKICLSISSYHPESWQPSWSVRSALIALIAFMQTPGNGAVGSLDHPPEVRRQIAAEARVNPPKHPNPDRQQLIDAMHQKMLSLESKSIGLYSEQKQMKAVSPSDAHSEATKKMFDSVDSSTLSGKVDGDNCTNKGTDGGGSSSMGTPKDATGVVAKTELQASETTCNVVVAEALAPATKEKVQQEPLSAMEWAKNANAQERAVGEIALETGTSLGGEGGSGNGMVSRRIDRPTRNEIRSMSDDATREMMPERHERRSGRIVSAVGRIPTWEMQLDPSSEWEDRLLSRISIFLIIFMAIIIIRRFVLNWNSSDNTALFNEDTVLFSSQFDTRDLHGDL